jgi:hypothetical protein
MDRADRLNENQQTFKLANERLESAVAERVEPDQRVPFLCECADETCMGQVDLTLADYGAIRARGDYFLMLSNHRLSPGEQIVEHRDGYDISQKPD